MLVGRFHRAEKLHLPPLARAEREENGAPRENYGKHPVRPVPRPSLSFLGRTAEAWSAYEKALTLTQQEPSGNSCKSGFGS